MKRNLRRTIAALAAYDAADEKFKATGTQEEVLAEFANLEKLALDVGVAFCLDTPDINSMSCAGSIKPGHAIPGPGCELSFVRRMVEKLG